MFLSSAEHGLPVVLEGTPSLSGDSSIYVMYVVLITELIKHERK